MLLFTRSKPQTKITLIWTIISTASSIAPLCYQFNFDPLFTTDFNDILAYQSLIGIALSFWGIVTLGDSFGISPAFRRRVGAGPYRYFKHPIYLGYVISETAIVLSNAAAINLAIISVSFALYFIRAKQEQKLMANYL